MISVCSNSYRSMPEALAELRTAWEENSVSNFSSKPKIKCFNSSFEFTQVGVLGSSTSSNGKQDSSRNQNQMMQTEDFTLNLFLQQRQSDCSWTRSSTAVPGVDSSKEWLKSVQSGHFTHSDWKLNSAGFRPRSHSMTNHAPAVPVVRSH